MHIFVEQQWKFMELCLETGSEPAEALWVRINRQPNVGDVVMGACYRLLDLEEGVEEAFFRQLGL